ncbi:uncharacterized protein UDID_00949 [Ustilago sp. UG-2017a]|nr:uncharacterized protein UDID_00949 [Ustilago sp. UG-2017a]SPC63687.1 uncharacterized protein UHOD_00949 [Ustilago sp. UG-2017b]
MIPVLVESFDPLPRHLCLSLPSSATAGDILSGFTSALSRTTSNTFSITHHGRRLSPSSHISTLHSHNDDSHPVVLQIRALLPGGKGGFGSMLRSQGGKMSSGSRNTNNDSCRDLNGRRLGVVKEAKKLAEYLQGESERKRQMDEAQKKKYAKLEKMLGRAPKSEKDLAEAAERMADAGEVFGSEDGSRSPELQAGSSKRAVYGGSGGSGVAGVKRKEIIEDSQYVEQSREIVENVRSAVASAMMKKKKPNKAKAKAATASSSNTSSNTCASVSAST